MIVGEDDERKQFSWACTSHCRRDSIGPFLGNEGSCVCCSVMFGLWWPRESMTHKLLIDMFMRKKMSHSMNENMSHDLAA